MRQSEYERRRQALEKQREEDLELIRAAYEAKLRALETLRSASPEEENAATEPVPSVQTGSETPAPSETRDPSEAQEKLRVAAWGKVPQAVQDVLPRLPEVFERRDVVEALGFEPRRATLFRALQDLIAQGQIMIVEYSDGRHGTKYRKVAGPE